MPDAVVIERLNRAFGRIKSYERIGLGDETLRELDALPLAVRELPSNQLRRGRVLERLERFAEAIKIYDQMEPSTLSQLGRVRCLSHLGRRAEAARFLDKIPFDPAVVREFVEARDSLR